MFKRPERERFTPESTDQCITLDLDDGVRVNYGQFGELLAAVKAVTGRKDKE